MTKKIDHQKYEQFPQLFTTLKDLTKILFNAYYMK